MRFSRLYPAWLLVPVLFALTFPATARATDLTSESGFLFDIQDMGWGGGSLSNGSIDAYDGCYYLQVDGVDYNPPAPVPPETVVLSLDGRQVEMPELTMGSLVVRRMIYVPSPGPSWARYVDVISNPTSSPITTTVAVYGNLGSDGGTVVFASSSGDTTVSPDDTWFSTDDMDGDWDPSLAHVVQGTSPAVAPTEVSISFDNLRYEWTLTIPSGGRAVLMTFAVQDMTQAVVQAEARRLLDLPDDALVGIDDLLGDIVNWSASAPCAGAEGSACTVRGRTGTCHASRCCTGCWNGTRCSGGTSGTACGVNGGACASCADGDLCTSDVCTVGVCSNPFAPPGTSCDDGLFCSTGDVCNGSGTCTGSGPPPCDDARACTLDSCDEAADACGHVMGAGCIIGGECVPEGRIHPSYPCLICDPARSTTDWSVNGIGSACGMPSCSGGRYRPGGTCDASGLCVASPSVRCETGACASATECEMPCAATGCASGEYCAPSGSCTAQLGQGDACTSDAACGTGHCVDGVCCETACDGTCESCRVSGSAGTCTPVPAGTDPDRECGADRCDGAGACAPVVVMRDAGTPADAGTPTEDAGAPVMDGGSVTPDAGTAPPARSGGCSVATGARASFAAIAVAVAAVLAAGRRRRQR